MSHVIDWYVNVVRCVRILCSRGNERFNLTMDNDEGSATEFRHRPSHNDVTLSASLTSSNAASVVDNGDVVGMTSSSAVAAAVQYQENVPSPIHSTLRRMTSRGSNTTTSTYNAMTNYDHANEDSHLSNCDAPARERPAVSRF
jgi:hypothetical protein